MKLSEQSGIALILVILVLTALVLIGTPFALSMRQQELASQQTVAERQAEFAATSARNRAVAHLMLTHPTRDEGVREIALAETSAGDERDGDGDGEAAKPRKVPESKIDERAELEVDLASLPLDLEANGKSSATSATGPAGTPYETRAWDGEILDVAVEDEQGKVNLNSAFPLLIGNLLASGFLSEAVDAEATTTEIPLDDTASFPADHDPETVDGVVAILNPFFFTVEAVSYTGKTDTHLTGCFRGEYLSIPQEHQQGWPVFDIRALKVFLHRYYNLDQGELRTFRTPQSIREIAEWSIVPYFLENLAVLGLNLRNMDEFGLTPEMLLRSGLDQKLLERTETEVGDEEYQQARRKLRELGVSDEIVDLLEKFRGRAAVVQAVVVVEKLDINRLEIGAVNLGYESQFKKELEKIKRRTRGYFPKAIESYRRIYDQPGCETFTAADFEKIRDLITTTSAVPAEWSAEQMVIGEIQHNPILGVPSLQVGRSDWFNPGTLVRIRSNRDPEKVEYQLAWFHSPSTGGGFRGGQRRGGDGGDRGEAFASLFQGGIILKGPLRHSYDEREALVSALLRHPVNINSASRLVLESVLIGLRFGITDEPGVSRKEARALVSFLLDEMPIVDFGHLRDLVETAATKEVIDSRHVTAILTNALNPNHPFLGFSTTGFCYATGDVYSVESMGVVNSSAGLELGRSHVREVIDVAPPDPLKLVLHSQEDWNFRMFATVVDSPSMWDVPTVSFRQPARDGHLMISGPVPIARRRFEVPAMDEGYLAGLTTEVSGNAYTWGDVEHFTETIEGHDTANDGLYTRESTREEAQEPASEDAQAPPPVIRDLITLPGAVEFWVKPNWTSRTGDRTFFDSLADPAQPLKNRIRLYFDGGTQEIVLQIMDDAGLQKGTPGSVRSPSGEVLGAGEIRHQVTTATFANDTWYHLRAVWGSTFPGDQALYIDGRLVGRNTWLTRLASPLAALGEKVTLADAAVADRFPARGTLLVGTEAIDYVEKEGTVFEVRRANAAQGLPPGRGTRGTIRQEHPRDAPVRLFGYAIDVAPSDPEHRMDSQGDWLLVGRGGAKLAHDLPISMRFDWSIMRAVPYHYAEIWPLLNGVQMIVEPSRIIIPAAASPVDPARLGFPIQDGYIYLMQWRLNLAQATLYLDGEEYIKYARMRPTSGQGGTSYEITGLGRGMLGTKELNTAPTAGAFYYAIRSVSIKTDVTDLGDRYPPSGIIQIDRGFGGKRQQSDPSLSDVEWIHYWTIAEGRYFIGAPWPTGRGFRGFNGEVRYDPNRPRVTNRNYFDEASISAHPEGFEIFPVLRLARPYASADDYVSIGDTEGGPADRKSEPTLLRIRKARETGRGFFVSLWQQTANSYFVHDMPKVKRFPSGELPARSSGRMVFGGAADSDADGGSLGAIIDEVRLSRTAPDDAEITPFPLDRGRRLTLDEAPKLPGAPQAGTGRVIRTRFTEGAGVEEGAELDRLLLLGQRSLGLVRDAEGKVAGRAWSYGGPSEFGLGKPEGLFSLGGEVFHYTMEPEESQQAIVQLIQDLPRDPLYVDSAADDDYAYRNVFDVRRDLRSEVIPSIRVSDTSKLPPRDGFLEIISQEDREVVYYERAGNGLLINCLRGQLGTSVLTHIYEWEIWGGPQRGWQVLTNEINMRVVPRQEIDLRTRSMLGSERRGTVLTKQSLVTIPQVGITRFTSSPSEVDFPVLSTAEFTPGNGYIILDDGDSATEDEILGYTGASGELFLRARDDRTGRGLFRGRFGTPVDRNPVRDTVAVEFYARYHDHYEPEADSHDLSYFQRAFRNPGTRWDAVRWEEKRLDNVTSKVEVRVVARLDGNPGWDEKPSNRPGGLFLFHDRNAVNPVDAEADELEFRIYFRYPPGSYGRAATGSGGGWSDDWKRTPILDQLTLDYRKRWRILHREDLRF